MKQFEEEVISVEQFLKNENINFCNFSFSKKDEPCDVYCENTKQQFQIRWSDDKFQKEIRTKKSANIFGAIEKRIRDIIIDPAFDKIDQYGKSAKDIILLLIYPKGNINKASQIYIEKAKDEIRHKENNYFKEIYLVCPKFNILLYKK